MRRDVPRPREPMIDHATLDWVTDAVLQADARGEPIGPDAIALLLRRYVATGRDDVRDALERGLAHGLHQLGADAPPADWMVALAEAAAYTGDERILPALDAGARARRREWPSREEVAPALTSVGACLTAATASGGDADVDLIAAAIDELERVLGRVYRPGEALARSLRNPDEPDGGLAEHVAAAGTLLVAHAVTGRLPYSMLAEELMQTALTAPSDDFAARCGAARVLCRLAVLHDDDEYRRAAVVAATDYRDAARAVLEALTPAYRALGAGAAIYGVALDEFLAVINSGTHGT